MTRESSFSHLTDEQRRRVCLILSVGCDRETAAKYAECSPGDIRQEMSQDERFAAEVWRAEATSEMTHMRNVQNAARDEKNWRASVWWLERRAPERYGRREAGTVTTKQLECFVAVLVSVVMEEIHDPADRERLLGRLDEIGKSLYELNASDEPVAAGGHRELPKLPPPIEEDSSETFDDSDAEGELQ